MLISGVWSILLCVYNFEVRNENKTSEGHLFSIRISGREINLLFTFHAMERIERWNIKREDVIETLIFPDEVLKGHRERFIAHKIYGEHIMRCVYEYKGEMPVIITVYFPYK